MRTILRTGASIALLLLSLSCGGGGAPGGQILSALFSSDPTSVPSVDAWGMVQMLSPVPGAAEPKFQLRPQAGGTCQVLIEPRLVEVGREALFTGLEGGNFCLTSVKVGDLPQSSSVAITNGQTLDTGLHTLPPNPNPAAGPTITRAGHTDLGGGMLKYYACIANNPLDYQIFVLIWVARIQLMLNVPSFAMQPDSIVNCASGPEIATTGPAAQGFSATGSAAGYTQNNANTFLVFGSTGVDAFSIQENYFQNNSGSVVDHVHLRYNYNAQLQTGMAPWSFAPTLDAQSRTYVGDLTGGLLLQGGYLDVHVFGSGTIEPHLLECELFQGATDLGSCASDQTEEGTMGTVTGRVVNSGGNPIAGATVTITHKAQDYTATSSADGTYTIPNVPAGESSRQISATGHATATDQPYLLEGPNPLGDTALN